MFELLISVSGIGAKSAIAMLSEISPSSFALAVISDDISKLVKVPGIGKKSIEKLLSKNFSVEEVADILEVDISCVKTIFEKLTPNISLE